MNKEQQINPIKKIIHKLSRTKLGFVWYSLKVKGECRYCAEGVLARGLVPTELLYRYDNLKDLLLNNDEYEIKMYAKYGTTFYETYENPIDCIFCHSELISLNHVIYHLNDNHSDSHKQTAEFLERFDKRYDLLTGLKK